MHGSWGHGWKEILGGQEVPLAENSGWSFTVSVCIIATAERLECLSDHLFSL